MKTLFSYQTRGKLHEEKQFKTLQNKQQIIEPRHKTATNKTSKINEEKETSKQQHQREREREREDEVVLFSVL